MEVVDGGAEAAPVGVPCLGLGELLWAQAHGHGLACDLAGPQHVGAVQLRGVRVAAAARGPTAQAIGAQGAGKDQAAVGQCREERPVALFQLAEAGGPRDGGGVVA